MRAQEKPASRTSGDKKSRCARLRLHLHDDGLRPARRQGEQVTFVRKQAWAELCQKFRCKFNRTVSMLRMALPGICRKKICGLSSEISRLFIDVGPHDLRNIPVTGITYNASNLIYSVKRTHPRIPDCITEKWMRSCVLLWLLHTIQTSFAFI
jgi:hypothetical protein